MSPFCPMAPSSGQHCVSGEAGCGWLPLPGQRGKGWDRWCLCLLQSQQPPQPSQHLPRSKGDSTLKMRASVRMTRYLESWGAARPFAHLNQRESVSSNEMPVLNGRRPKVGPLLPESWEQGPWEGGRRARAKGVLAAQAHIYHLQRGSEPCPASLPPFWGTWGSEGIWPMLQAGWRW